jgi:hypothetical protein
MRIRAAKFDELSPKNRELTPRQLAAFHRDEEIRGALGQLQAEDDILAIELDPAEKIPTMRLAVKRAIAAHRPDAHMAIRGRTIFLTLAAIPGGRVGRPTKGS